MILQRRVLVKDGKYPILYDNVSNDYEVTTEDTDEVLEVFKTLVEAENFIKGWLESYEV